MQRTNAVAVRPERPRPSEQPSQMTAARRAGLEALEREFSELLAAYHQAQAATTSAAA